MAAGPSFLDQEYLGREVHEQQCHGMELCLDKHYEITDVIGKGAYSIVFGGVDKRTGQKVPAMTSDIQFSVRLLSKRSRLQFLMMKSTQRESYARSRSYDK